MWFALCHTAWSWFSSGRVVQKQIWNLLTDRQPCLPQKPPTPKEWLKILCDIPSRFTPPNYTIPVWRILMRVCLWHFKVSSRDVTIVKIMWVSMTSHECSYLDRWQFQIWRFGDVKRTLGMQYGFTRGPSAAVCPHTAWSFAILRFIPHEDHTSEYCGLFHGLHP